MKRVVVADDNKFLLEQIVNGLKSCKEIDIIGTAKDGHEELKLIEELKPDVVVTDIEMPNMTGVEVIEIAKDFENAPEFIVVTGGSNAETMSKLYKLPIKYLFRKPVDIEKIIEQILLEVKEERNIYNNIPTEERGLFSILKKILKK